MAGPCDLPLVGRGCDTVGDAVGGAVGGAVEDAAGGVFDAAVDRIAEGFAKATQLMVTFWTDVDLPGLSTSSGPVAQLRADTAWLSAFVAVLSVLVCAGRLAVTRSSRPAGEAFKGLLILVVASGCGVAAVNALVVFGDSYADWVLDRSTDGQLGQRLVALATVGETAGLGSGLILIVALLGMFASIAQIGLMLVRVGVVTILAGLLPLAAAGTGTQTGMEFFKRVVAWLLAFVAYKPAAATVYASAFLLIGDGQDATSVLSGLFLLVLSIVALPALLRLVTPMVGAAVAAGAGAGGGLAAAGMVLATGARLSASSGGHAGPPMPGGGQAGLLPPAVGLGARPTGGAPAGSAAAAPGGGGAGAAAQAGVQVALAGMQAARGAAAHATDLGERGAPAPAQPAPAQASAGARGAR